MKHDTIEQYTPYDANLPVQALLTVWDCLPAYRADLALVGGLAIRFLTKPPAAGQPGPVTLDVDFGIGIAASNEMYPGIRETLSGLGFAWEKQRFTKTFSSMTLFVDLLTDDGLSDTGTVLVDTGLPVSVVPGIDRALACCRTIAVQGQTLVGAMVAHSVRVADIGPMLVLKLNAFGGPFGRKAPKDVHDVLYLAMNCDGGAPAAVESFRAERTARNRGVAHAVNCLREYFKDEDSQGPVSCAAFRLNNRHREAAFADEALGIRQQCVTLARALLD